MNNEKRERCDTVNDSLRLIQITDGLTFGTDALLLAGYAGGGYSLGCELGGGSGIISMLLLTRGKLASATSVEIQGEYARLTERNAELNGLTNLTSVCADIREYKPGAIYDLVYTNPPYMKSDSGRANALSNKNAARHEINGDISDFAAAGERLLRFGGSFLAVYRPDRLTDLLFAMRTHRLEPKRVTFVHADTHSESSMVLVEARRGGGVGLMLTRPLIIYKDESHSEYTEDMKYIMEEGSFPPDFKRQR